MVVELMVVELTTTITTTNGPSSMRTRLSVADA
jgi:hypothetical protein